MMYSDQDLRQAISSGDLSVEPFVPENISAATLDLTLHKNFRVFHNSSVTHIDVKQAFEVTQQEFAGPDGSFVIHPGEFILGSTAEKVTLSNAVCGLLEGRSSLGRIGLIVHATASLVKPSFSGYITLEMSNISKVPIKLYAGMRVAQLALIELKTPSSQEFAQHSRYQHQEPPTPSRIWHDFEQKGKK